MRRMLVAVVSMTLVVSVLAAPSVTAGGRRTTYAMTDCQHLRTAPRSILFACGDGNFFVDHLTWFRWHRWKAVGGGLFHLNDCRPSCAEGTFHTAWGRLWLRNRARCDPPGAFVFQHGRVVYEGRLLGRHRTSFGHLGCPFR
ncbi:MAG TPA: hypothetical protein VLB31_11025 [Actinomycetota bacterium]|nr:hypothetical protein [Actinomycetota bacterium]